MDSETYDPNLKNLIENKELKWVFVGGKGGVGKTTTSSSIAIRMAKERESVLIISTDPAHNLSDAFDQKFSNEPIQVNGIDNLFCMEIDPQKNTQGNEFLKGVGLDDGGEGASFWSEIVGSVPGIDEATSFGEILRQVREFNFELIIFDTAPTGHTLRLLNFPNILDKALVKIISLKEKFAPMVNSLGGMMGTDDAGEDKIKMLTDKLDEFKGTIDTVNTQFKNHKQTTFVAVCIPEFLSMYETERLVTELVKYDIDIHNIVINQVLIPDDCSSCKKCTARQAMQKKYLDQILDLYDDFHIIQSPLLNSEVRGTDRLGIFQKIIFDNDLPADE